MTSIYQRAMGADFDRLHPMIQRRFGISTERGVASIGEGVMEEIWRGRFFTVPFLWFGSWRRIMFPDRGLNVPFRIENYAYMDPLGRETVTWIRSFTLHRRARRFDAYMIYSDKRHRVVDYLGSISTSRWIWSSQSAHRAAYASALASSVSMSIFSAFAFPYCFPGLPTCTSGTTTRSSATG